MTSPVQSSLRLVDLQFGQTDPLLIYLQFLQAFSVKPASPLLILVHDAYPVQPIPACLERAGAL